MGEGISFGRYRATPRTVWRPAFERFEPRYRIEPAVFDDLRAIERADQQLRGWQPSAPEARALLEEALTRNAYGTASIEGGPLTLAEVESLLVHVPDGREPRAPEEREILNYGRFIDGLPGHRLPRTPADVLALHGALFDGVLSDAGTFKEQPNFIGKRPEHEVLFVPTMPERVERELAQALDWLHDAPEHPLVKAMVFFHETQGIHPFRDGNGRTGRALATLVLHHLGYPGIRYAFVDYRFNEDRDAYYGNLARVEREGFDYTPWIAYMARVLRETFEGALSRFAFERGLPPGLHKRQRALALWFANLAREHPQRRVKFNDVHAAFPHVAARTLKRDLAALREEGIVRMEGERKAAAYSVPTRDDPPRADDPPQS